METLSFFSEKGVEPIGFAMHPFLYVVMCVEKKETRMEANDLRSRGWTRIWVFADAEFLLCLLMDSPFRRGDFPVPSAEVPQGDWEVTFTMRECARGVVRRGSAHFSEKNGNVVLFLRKRGRAYRLRDAFGSVLSRVRWKKETRMKANDLRSRGWTRIWVLQ